MSRQYTINIRNLSESTDRQVTVSCVSPMEAHKSVYMKTRQSEEIRTIFDEDGNIVFDLKKGFKKAY